MNLIYSCVFTNENYITLFKNLLTSYCRYNDTSNVCYLVITSKEFHEKIKNILIPFIKNRVIISIDKSNNSILVDWQEDY